MLFHLVLFILFFADDFREETFNSEADFVVLLWLLSEVTLDLIGFPTLTQVVSRNLPFTAEEPPEKGKGIWNVMLAFPAISLEA